MLVLLSQPSDVAMLTAILRQFEGAPAIIASYCGQTTDTDTVIDLTGALKSCSDPITPPPSMPMEWAIGTIEWYGVYTMGDSIVAHLDAPECVLSILAVIILQLNIVGVSTITNTASITSELVRVSPDFAYAYSVRALYNNRVLINELAASAQKIRTAISIFDNEGALNNYWKTLSVADLTLLQDRTIEAPRVVALMISLKAAAVEQSTLQMDLLLTHDL